MDVRFFYLVRSETALAVEVRIHMYRMPIKKRKYVLDPDNKSYEGSNQYNVCHMYDESNLKFEEK
jgi:hypothetical protein